METGKGQRNKTINVNDESIEETGKICGSHEMMTRI